MEGPNKFLPVVAVQFFLFGAVVFVLWFRIGLFLKLKQAIRMLQKDPGAHSAMASTKVKGEKQLNSDSLLSIRK